MIIRYPPYAYSPEMLKREISLAFILIVEPAPVPHHHRIEKRQLSLGSFFRSLFGLEAGPGPGPGRGPGPSPGPDPRPGPSHQSQPVDSLSDPPPSPDLNRQPRHFNFSSQGHFENNLFPDQSEINKRQLNPYLKEAVMFHSPPCYNVGFKSQLLPNEINRLMSGDYKNTLCSLISGKSYEVMQRLFQPFLLLDK